MIFSSAPNFIGLVHCVVPETPNLTSFETVWLPYPASQPMGGGECGTRQSACDVLFFMPNFTLMVHRVNVSPTLILTWWAKNPNLTVFSNSTLGIRGGALLRHTGKVERGPHN